MSISEAVRIWNLNANGLRIEPVLRDPSPSCSVGLWVNVLTVNRGKALLQRGRKVTWAENAKLVNKITKDGVSFVTMPAEVASFLV